MNTTNPFFALIILSLICLPSRIHAEEICDSNADSQVFYNQALSQLQICKSGSLVPLELPQASKEIQVAGPQGPTGPAGQDGNDAFGQIKGDDINLDDSSTLIDLSNGDFFDVSGAADLQSFKPAPAGRRALLHFTQNTWIKHDPNKIQLSGSGDYKIYGGDSMEFIARANGSWREIRRNSAFDSYIWAVWATAQTINVSTPITLIFDQEIEDTQNEYDSSTGEFTAAQNGLYLIEAHARSANTAWTTGNHLALSLQKTSISDASVSTMTDARNSAFSSVTQRMTVNFSSILRLSKGDKLRVILESTKANPIEASAGNSSVYFQIRKLR